VDNQIGCIGPLLPMLWVVPTGVSKINRIPAKWSAQKYPNNVAQYKQRDPIVNFIFVPFFGSLIP
jgi:hypothetical protein